MDTAYDAERGREDLERATGLATTARERALEQLEEAIDDREAALRTRARMEAQRDEAIAARAEAESRRDEVLVQRDEARRQRDEVLLAHRALQRRLKGRWAQSERGQPAAPAADAEQPGAAAVPTGPTAPPASPAEPRRTADRRARDPAARLVGAHLHRAGQDLDRGLTSYDLWVVRILGTVAAVAFIALLVMILKAFFVF